MRCDMGRSEFAPMPGDVRRIRVWYIGFGVGRNNYGTGRAGSMLNAVIVSLTTVVVGLVVWYVLEIVPCSTIAFQL